MGSRLLFTAAALAAAPVIVLAIAAASTPHRTDFKCFWTSAHLLSRGLDPYDLSVWSPAIAGSFENLVGRIGSHSCGMPDNYPLTSALLILPLGWLPLEPAAYLWALAGLAGLTLGVAFLARTAGIGRSGAFALAFVVFASPQALWNSIFQPHAGLLLAGLATLALPSARSSLPLTAIGVLLLAIKPHVAPLAVVERLSAALPTVRVGTAVILGAVAAISLWLVPSWPLEWLRSVASQHARWIALKTSTWSLVRELTGSWEIALFVCAALLGAFALALRGALLRDALERIAVAVTGWLLVLPYMSGQDLLVLAPAWCVLIRRGWLAPAFILAALVPWIALQVHPVLGLGVVAPITAAVLAISLRREAVPDTSMAAEAPL